MKRYNSPQGVKLGTRSQWPDVLTVVPLCILLVKFFDQKNFDPKFRAHRICRLDGIQRTAAAKRSRCHFPEWRDSKWIFLPTEIAATNLLSLALPPKLAEISWKKNLLL